MWETFPQELIDIILEYQGYHTWRNGKFIARLDKNDPRYNTVNKIPKIHKSTPYNYDACIWTFFPQRQDGSTSKCVIIHVSVLDNSRLWSMTTAYYRSGIDCLNYQEKHYIIE
jgi:hypothetical protein